MENTILQKIKYLLLIVLAVTFTCFTITACDDSSESDYSIKYMIDDETYKICQIDNGAIVDAPKNPTRKGYAFSGWYFDNDNWQEKLSNSSLDYQNIVSDLTVYAKFDIITYDITYHPDGGQHNNADSYDVNDSIELLPCQKQGFSFLGWYDDANFTNEITQIAAGTIGEIELFAKYDTIEYNVTYVADGGTHQNPTVFSINDNVVLKDAEKDNYTFLGWFSDESCTLKVESISGITQSNITLYAKFEATQYDIQYSNTKGAKNINPIAYTIENQITFTPIYSQGYTFLGWFYNENEITKIEAGTLSGNLVLQAKWSEANIEATKNIEQAGTISGLEKGLALGEEITLNATTNKGYTWLGWFNGNIKVSNGEDTQFTFINDGSQIVYTAKWAEYSLTVNQNKGGEVSLGYEVSFDLNGASGPTPQTQYVNSLVKLQFPEMSNISSRYLFTGWFNDPECTTLFDWSKDVSSDVKLYAGWKEVYIGYSANSEIINQSINHAVGLDLSSREWSYAYFTILDDSEIEVYYQYCEVYSSYPNPLGYDLDVEIFNITQNKVIDNNIHIQTNPYKYYEKHLLDSSNVNVGDRIYLRVRYSSDSISHNLYNFAYQITRRSEFDEGYGSISCISGNYSQGEEITVSATTYDGYTWSGWYDEDDKKVSGDLIYTFSMPYSDVTLTPKWVVNNYTITYEYDESIGDYKEGESNPVSYTVEDTITLNGLECSKRGYRFKGWYSNGQEVVEISNQTGNIQLIADWEPIVYTIMYENLNGADNSNVTQYTVDDETIILQQLSLNDFIFDGWFNGETQIESIVTGSIGDVVLTAKWLQKHTITYVYTDSVADYEEGQTNPLTYTEKDSVTLNGLIAKNNKITFDGWYNGENKITEITAGTTGDLVLTARYTSQYNLIYNANDLQSIAMSGDYLIVNDIQLGYEWVPIGSETAPFTGTLDGNGCLLNGMNITARNTHIGLFGYNSGTLSNIYLINANVNVSVSGDTFHVGGLAGYNAGTIQNSYVTGRVSAKGNITGKIYTGGLVGYSAGTIKNTYSNATVLASFSSRISDYSIKTYAGGLIGYASGTVTNSYATGNVSASSRKNHVIHPYSYAGGLIGYCKATVKTCYATGNVSASSYASSGALDAYAGGLVGYGGSTVSYSFATGSVEAYGGSTSSGTSIVTEEVRAGGLVSYLSVGEKCFRDSKQSVTSSLSVSKPINTSGTGVSLSNLQNDDWQKENVFLQTDIWNFDTTYPTLNFEYLLNL